jgi:BlaI family transcriptional regulator, penicillinase repressor
MPRIRKPRPTDAELTILRILWAKGPCTVRQVYEELARDRALGYTTALKLLQVMTEKGLTTREQIGPQQHAYRARSSEGDTQKQLLSDLLHRAFGGSMSQLVMQALATRKASQDELQAIRRLLKEHTSSSVEKNDE